MAKFNKGDKVKIINTNTVWDDKLGTVIKEADDEISSENGDDLTEVLVKVAFKADDDVKSIIQTFNRGNLELLPEENLNEEKNKMSTKLNKNEIWEELAKTEEEYFSNDERLIEEFIDPKDDFLKPYVTYEDEEGKKIDAWMFIDRIMAAENVDEPTLTQCAQKHGYKLFYVEAGEFNKIIVGGKSITKDDIAEEFADYLLGNAYIEEIK